MYVHSILVLWWVTCDIFVAGALFPIEGLPVCANPRVKEIAKTEAEAQLIFLPRFSVSSDNSQLMHSSDWHLTPQPLEMAPNPRTCSLDYASLQSQVRQVPQVAQVERALWSPTVQWAYFNKGPKNRGLHRRASRLIGCGDIQGRESQGLPSPKLALVLSQAKFCDMAPCNVPQLPLKDLRNAQEPPATCNLDLSNRERNSGADSVLPDAEKTTPPCTGCHADVLAPESPTEDMGDCNAEAALSGSVTDWIPSDFDPTPGPGPRRLVRPGGAPTAHRLVILLVALCGAMALIGRACTILGRTGDAHRAGTRPSPPPPAPPPDSPTSPTPSLPHKEGQQWTVSARAIGSGGYATVYQAHDRLTGEIVAVKKMPVPGVENDAEFREVEKEARLLAGLRHDNTVSYLGRFTEGRVLHLVMEYVPWGSLDALVQTYKYIPMPALRRYATDILRGLDYLHRHLFIHRDIKPANILVGQHGCKLSDFGLSCAQPHHVDPQGKAARTGPKGTPAYMSLEAIEGYPCTKSDVWAYGLTLLEVASGERPWGWLCVSRPIQLLAKVGQELRAKAEYELPAWLPVGFAAFLRRCLRTRSDERSAAGPLLGDEWLVTFDREEASVVPPKFRGLSARSSAYSTTSEYTETGTEDSSAVMTRTPTLPKEVPRGPASDPDDVLPSLRSIINRRPGNLLGGHEQDAGIQVYNESSLDVYVVVTSVGAGVVLERLITPMAHRSSMDVQVLRLFQQHGLYVFSGTDETVHQGSQVTLIFLYADDHENIVRMETFRSAAKMDWVAEDKSTYALGRIGLR